MRSAPLAAMPARAAPWRAAESPRAVDPDGRAEGQCAKKPSQAARVATVRRRGARVLAWGLGPALVARVSFALVASAVGGARAAEPDSLGALAALALERHPEIAALGSDTDAARALVHAAGRPLDPQWMLGAEALGAVPDSVDPTMFMVGVEQVIALPPAYRASRERAALDLRWAAGERARVEADVEEALWEAAARLRAHAAQGAALDGQIAAAEAALAFGRAGYATGAGGPAAGSSGGASDLGSAVVPPPAVVRPATMGGGAGGGMGGMGAASGGGTSRASVGGGMGGGGMAAMGGSGGVASSGGGMASMGVGGMAAPMGQGGLAALLRLDVEVARARAERDALAARRAGEEARLALVVGDDAARVVAADPARFLGAALDAAVPPERTLAAISVEMAEADVTVTRAGRLPVFMVGADLRVMPGGMVEGADAEVGVTLPIWGGSRARVQAATAAVEAASRRSEGVDRGLADALAAARADEAAATARERALTEVAVPGARAAWDATVAAWGAGAATAADLVAAWQASVAVARDAADAQLAAELARARRARLEGA